MAQYEIIMYWSEVDQAYIAEVPELAGCMADGSTQEECLAHIQQVIDQWLDTARSLGRDIPVARGKLMYA